MEQIYGMKKLCDGKRFVFCTNSSFDVPTYTVGIHVMQSARFCSIPRRDCSKTDGFLQSLLNVTTSFYYMYSSLKSL